MACLALKTSGRQTLSKPSGVKPYDVYNPEARDIYWDFMNRGIFSLGMDGWWLDSTEPDHLDIERRRFR